MTNIGACRLEAVITGHCLSILARAVTLDPDRTGLAVLPGLRGISGQESASRESHFRDDQMRNGAGLSGRAGCRRCDPAIVRIVLDLGPVRFVGQILSGPGPGHRPVRDGARAGTARGEGHLYVDHIQFVQSRRVTEANWLPSEPANGNW